MASIQTYFWLNTAAIGPRRHIVNDVREIIEIGDDLIEEAGNLVPAKTVIGGADDKHKIMVL